jgi:hypothetical protein
MSLLSLMTRDPFLDTVLNDVVAVPLRAASGSSRRGPSMHVDFMEYEKEYVISAGMLVSWHCSARSNVGYRVGWLQEGGYKLEY